MKLVECLAGGITLGLETTEEAVMDIVLHANSYFTYDSMREEVAEIFEELKSLNNATKFITYKGDGGIRLVPNVYIKDYFPEAVELANKYIDQMYGGN